MNVIDRVSTNIAGSIKRNYPDAVSANILRYSLNGILNFFVTASIVLLISAIFGKFLVALLCVWAFPVLRYFSGGMHFRSNTVCNIVSSLFILFAIFVPIEYWQLGFVLNIFSAIIVLINAPSNVTQGTLDKKYYPILKWIACFVVCINFYFESSVLSIAFFIQALTTFSVSQKLIDKLSW